MLQPGALELLVRIRRMMDRYPGTATMGEVSSQPGAFERVVAYTAGSERLHMAYTLRPLRGGFDWATVRSMLQDAADAGDAGWVCWSFSNHDVERAVSRWNPRRGRGLPPDPAFARLLMAMLLSLRGSACIYQGEELGLTEAELTLEQLRDPFGIAYWPEFRGRDGSRTPIPWRAGAPHAGFTDGEMPWLPLPSAHHALAVDREEADQQALLHAFRRFLKWRRSQPALRSGELLPLDLPAPLVGFVRRTAGQSVLAVFNLSEQGAVFDAGALPGMRLLPDSGFLPLLEGDAARLPPHGALFAELAPASQAELALVLGG
jgi:alpha-glucosidase